MSVGRDQSVTRKSMRDGRDDHVRADGQGVFIRVAVGIWVGKLFPTVAQVEPAVNYGEPPVEGDSGQTGRIHGSEVLGHARSVFDLTNIVVGVVQGVIAGKRLELILG